MRTPVNRSPASCGERLIQDQRVRLLSAQLIWASCFLLVGCDLQPGTTSRSSGSATGTSGDQPDGTNSGDDTADDQPDTTTDITPDTFGLPCITCHSSQVGERRKIVDADGAGGHDFGGATLTNDDCVVCHDASEHQGGSVRLWLDPNAPQEVITLDGDPRQDPEEAGKLVPFCKSCHTQRLHGGHPVDGEWQPTCIGCHNPHEPDGQNLSLIASTVLNQTTGLNKSVVFTARQGAKSYDDGDPASNDGICQVCHTGTDFHRHDGSGIPHNDGETCIDCHRHEDGFLPSAGDSCIACHSAPQGKRSAVVDATGVGGHHLGGEFLTDTDCERCHNQSQHRQGVVRLWADPNDPSDVIILGGEPGSDPAEADKLTPFCQSCHSAGEYAVHDVPGMWTPACVACHSMHDPADTNRSAIAPLVHNLTLGQDKPILLTSRSGPGSFSDGVEPNNGICQACHTQTQFHRHDGSGDDHNAGTDCIVCHPHAAGFKPSGESCITCHSEVQGSRPAVITAEGLGSHHLADPVLTDQDCLTCHEMTAHKQGNVRLWLDPNMPTEVIELAASPLIDPSESLKLVPFCTSCHTNGNSIHAVGSSWQPACGTCHDLHNPGNTNLRYITNQVFNQTLQQNKTVVFSARVGLGSFSDGAGANDGICQVCHTSTTHHLHDGNGTAHNESTDCTQCHAHNAGFLPVDEASCIVCHSSPQGLRPPVVNADGSGGHHLGGGALLDSDCAQCHDTAQHQGGAVRLWDDPTNPTSSFAVNGDPVQLESFCSNCHSGADHPIMHATGAAWEPTCTECHDLHDPANNNLSLVSANVLNQTLSQSMPVVFSAESGLGSFSDGVGANDGICQVCHTTTAYHRYDGSGTSHNDAANCTACHEHSGGFIPSGQTSCVGCHSSPQGLRRAVVGEFGLASHHVSGAAVTDADCTVCHDQSAHQGGQVRLKDADDPSTVFTLAGDPLSLSAEAAKLEPFCLSCHDADAAGGSAPFSNGATPQVINAALWAGATHSTGQTTCVGDGETFGCHSTGHGSAKANLLAPWDGSQAGISGDPLREEEGFCYSCHDGNGPAAVNVQAIFAQASHHNVSDDDQVDGSKIECVSCHNPHTASPSAPLIHPDSGAIWSGDGRDFCLTCHDGSGAPGVAFPALAPGSGYNKSQFAGTTHDVQLGADACSACHDPHGSPHQATLLNRYVVNDFNQYSTGDGDYASCWACHNENFIIEQKNNFGERHKKHVKGEDAPCIACHNVHGGFDASELGLIDLSYPDQHGFDFDFISGSDPSSAFWLNGTLDAGFCLLQCHGENHNPEDYDRN